MSARTSKQAVFLRQKQVRVINWRAVQRISWFVSSAALLAWGVIQLQRPDLLPIQKIQALGTFQHVDEAMLRGVVANTVKGGYFTVNVKEVQAAVEELPWIASASVSRMWPDTLAINVTEQQANARWAKGGLVNHQGVVFFPKAATYPRSLPVFDGPSGMERNMTENYKLAKEIIAPLALEITEFRMDSRRAINLFLSNGLELVLGREDTRKRLERFVRIYQKVLVQRVNEIALVDMRYSNGLAVGWRKQKAGE